MARRPSSPTASSAAAEDPDGGDDGDGGAKRGDASIESNAAPSSPRDAPDESASRRASGSVWTMIRRATSGARARTCAARASALWASTEGAATSAASPASSSNADGDGAQRGVRGRAGLVRLGDGEEAVEEVGVALGPLALGDVGVRLGELGDGEGCESPGGRDETREDGAGEETATASGRTCHRRSNADSTAELRSHCRGAAAPISSTPPSRMGDEVGVKRVSRAQRQASGRSRRATSSASSERRSSEDVEGGEEGGQHGSHPRERGRATAGEDAIAKGAGHHPARLRRWEAGEPLFTLMSSMTSVARASLPRIMRRM